MVQLVAWAACLATIFLSAMAVHYLSEVRGAVQPAMTDFMHISQDSFAKEAPSNHSLFTSSFSLLVDV